MRKVLFLLIIATMFFGLAPTVLAIETTLYPNEIVVLVMNQETKLTVLLGDESTNNIALYDLDIAGDCSLADFKTGDFVSIASAQQTIPVVGDKIVSVASLDNIFSGLDPNSTIGPLEFTTCSITAITLKQGNLSLYMAAQLDNNTFAVQSMESQSYLLDNQSSCLTDYLGDMSIIFVNQSSKDVLKNGDQVVYGMKFDTNFVFNIVEVNNCPIGDAKKVKTSTVSYLSTDWPKQTITVSDLYSNQAYNLTLNSGCKLLSATDWNEGEITYWDNTAQPAQPIYVSFISPNLSLQTNSSFTSLLQDSVCRVTSYQAVTNPIPAVGELYQRPTSYINIPVLTHYNIGKWGKKIYTDRPAAQTMIGALVKGETDPATYIVDTDGKLRWLKDEPVAKRLFGDDWDSQIIWFNDSIIYTYQFGETIDW